MGHRANIVVVDGVGWRLRYSHWAANGIYRHLAAGPDAALRFARAQSEVDRETGWLNDRWAEGGFLIDVARRVLTWWGNDWMSDLGVRRAFASLLAVTWPGWEVTFWGDAYEEQLARAPYVTPVARVDEAEGLATLAKLLLAEAWTPSAPGPWFDDMIHAERSAGVIVDVNPAVALHADVPPVEAETSRIRVALGRLLAP